MAKGFKHGAGGGVIGINFDVVAYATEDELTAATPKENTIGVITSDKITGWVFSATEPTEPMEGMVWFYLGTFSNAEFNALKKNGINVYPQSAKQYIVGSWVRKTSKVYQSEQWVELWNGELFYNGNQYEFITGGWAATAVKSGGSHTACKPDLTFVDGKMVMAVGSGSGNRSGIVHNVDPIDITKHTTLQIEAENVVTGDIRTFTTFPTDLNSGIVSRYTLSNGINNFALPNADSIYIGFNMGYTNGSSSKATVIDMKLI